MVLFLAQTRHTHNVVEQSMSPEIGTVKVIL